MPARPNAGGMSVGAFWPSRKSSASNLPGPQLVRTARVVSSGTPSSSLTTERSGAKLTIWPTSRSRLAQPSRRRPMPESEGVVDDRMAEGALEADGAQRRRPRRNPSRRRRRSASAERGSSRDRRDRRGPASGRASASPGSASTSTFSPSARAWFGLSPGPTPPLAAPAMAWWSFRASPQKASSPKVSKRNVRFPSAIERSAWPKTEASDRSGLKRSSASEVVTRAVRRERLPTAMRVSQTEREDMRMTITSAATVHRDSAGSASTEQRVSTGRGGTGESGV